MVRRFEIACGVVQKSKSVAGANPTVFADEVTDLYGDNPTS
jgi:hypothetical protein